MKPTSEGEAEELFAMLASNFKVERLPGEIPYTVLSAWDWVCRMTGLPRDACERDLMPTTHRLFVIHAERGQLEAIRLTDITDLNSKVRGAVGLVRFNAGGQHFVYSTKRLAAPAFVSLLQDLQSGEPNRYRA